MCLVFLCDEKETVLGTQQAPGSCPYCSGAVVATDLESRWTLCFLQLCSKTKRRTQEISTKGPAIPEAVPNALEFPTKHYCVPPPRTSYLFFLRSWSGHQFHLHHPSEKIQRETPTSSIPSLRLLSPAPSSALPHPMAMRSFYNEIRGLKLRDLPGHLKPMMSLDYVKRTIAKGFDRYHDKYIETSSIQPMYHVCFGGMAFSYLVALPEERRHLEHQQHQHGGGGHH